MNTLKTALRKLRWLLTILLVIMLSAVLLGACTATPAINSAEATLVAEFQPTAPPKPTSTPVPPSPTPTEPPPTLREIAEGIAADEGVIIDVIEGDPERVIYVFEERHNSILDQIEIAIMFNRLYIEQGMRHIGLEGLTTEQDVMALSWAHTEEAFQSDQFITSREDVFVQMAQDGILNNAELIGLIYNDVQVHGIDDAALYAITVDNPSIWYAPYDYNYQIALIMMGEDDFNFWKELMSKNEVQLAYDYAINTSPYAQEMIERLRSGLSAEAFIEILDELVVKADEEAQKADLTMNQDLVTAKDELLEYMDVVVARSEAMAEAMLDLLETYPGAPLALTTGNMHGDRMVEIFAEAGVSVVWLHPLALAEGNQAGLFSDEAYARYEQGFSPSPDGTLGAMLDGRRKPTPRGEKPETVNEAKVRQALQRLMNQVLDWQKLFDEYPNELEWRGIARDFIISWNRSWVLTPQKIYFSSLPTLRTPENTPGLDHVEIDFSLLLSGGELKGTLQPRPGSSGKGEKTLAERLDKAKTEVSEEEAEEVQDEERLLTESVTEDVCDDTKVTWHTEG